MGPPSALYLECPSCGDETLHRVLKGRTGDKKSSALEAVVKCSECGHKYRTTVKAEKSITVPVIVSEQERSEKDGIELSENETITVGNEYILGRNTIKITAIEIERGRVQSSEAKDVISLWAKKFDRLKLPVSINRGSSTLSRIVWAVPDEEFFIGDVMRLKGMNVTIHRIKTRDRSIKRGSAQARDIVRLYAKIVK